MASFDFGQTIAAARMHWDSEHDSEEEGSSVDTKGYEGVAVVTNVGEETSVDLSTDSMSITFYECETDDFSSASEVDSGRVITNPDIDDENEIFVASVVPSKRYLWAQLPAPDSGSVEIAVQAILGHSVKIPTE